MTQMKAWLLCFVFAGCCASVETRIEDKTYTLPVPIIRDSILVRVDTVLVAGEKIIHSDTVFTFKYYPAEKKVVYVVRPDSVKFTVRDTVSIVKQLDDPHTFTWKIGFGAIVLLCGGAVVGSIKVLRLLKVA